MNHERCPACTSDAGLSPPFPTHQAGRTYILVPRRKPQLLSKTLNLPSDAVKVCLRCGHIMNFMTRVHLDELRRELDTNEASEQMHGALSVAQENPAEGALSVPSKERP